MAFDQTDRTDSTPGYADNQTYANRNDDPTGDTQAPQDPAIDPNGFYNAVAGFYKTALGREGTQQEILGWINGKRPDQLGSIQTAIYASPEAKAYQAKQNTQNTTNKPSAADYIKQWQGSHAPNLQELLDNMKTMGYNVSPYMYGSTASKNEILLDGQKFKVLGGENSANPFWYTGGDDSGPNITNGSIQTGQGNSGPPKSIDDYVNYLLGKFNGGSADTNKVDPAKMQELMNNLFSRSNQSLNINPQTDPNIRGQVDAARVEQERSRKSYLDDMAEAGNPYATGAQNTAARQTAEKVGTNVSNLQSTLVQNELNARRGEITQALQEEGQLLTTDQQLALQKQLGLIDSALKDKSLDINNNQFLQNLLLQRSFLDSQNDQFAANFGFNTTDRANYWDWMRRNGGK